MRILVVEDDSRLAEELVRAIKARGFETELMVNGSDAEAQILKGGFDLVLLDLMLPGTPGLELLKRIQFKSACPVIVMSARQDVSARLESFQHGALDFVAKPFFFAELLLRIDVRLGLSRKAAAESTQWANAVLYPKARTLSVEGKPVELTHHEMSILLTLISQRPDAVTRQQLVVHALGPGGDTSARTVDSHVTRLRQKLGSSAGAAIRTVWRVGYRFSPIEDSPP
jgi:DNA-binding response OmpR family regulator